MKANTTGCELCTCCRQWLSLRSKTHTLYISHCNAQKVYACILCLTCTYRELLRGCPKSKDNDVRELCSGENHTPTNTQENQCTCTQHTRVKHQHLHVHVNATHIINNQFNSDEVYIHMYMQMTRAAVSHIASTQWLAFTVYFLIIRTLINFCCTN